MDTIKDLYSLNEFIESKNQELSDLKRENESLKNRLQTDMRFWNIGNGIPFDDFRKNLPVPRLEMIYSNLPNNAGSQWVYGIVRLAHYGLRPSEFQYNFTPLSKTTTSAYLGKQANGKLSKPYRDMTHIRYDIVSMGLPAYFTCPELELVEQIEFTDSINTQFENDLKTTY